MPPLLIHDLQDSQMFALAQAAGRAGMNIQGFASSNMPWISACRYISRCYITPSLGDVAESIYALNIKKTALSGVWLPCVDDIAMFTADFQPFLQSRGIASLVASTASMERADLTHLQDYQGTLKIPETHWLTCDDLQEKAKQLTYPILLKSARGHFQIFSTADAIQQHLQIIASQTSLLQRVQHYIEGETSRMATAILLFDPYGEVVRGFTGRRLRVAQTKHGAFGETTAAKSEWIPELYHGAVALLRHLNWQGFAEVECKQGADGQWYVMEINPRLSGWTCLAEADGAGLLQAYYHLCTQPDLTLREACLQRSHTDYIRFIASEDHTPDWAHTPRLQTSKRAQAWQWLQGMGRIMYHHITRRPTLSAGAWDWQNKSATWALLKHTFQVHWNR